MTAAQHPTAARRGLLMGAIAALTVPKVATAAPSTVSRVDAAAAELAEALGQLHGGQWSITVDHANGFALLMAPKDGGAA